MSEFLVIVLSNANGFVFDSNPTTGVVRLALGGHSGGFGHEGNSPLSLYQIPLYVEGLP